MSKAPEIIFFSAFELGPWVPGCKVQSFLMGSSLLWVVSETGCLILLPSKPHSVAHTGKQVKTGLTKITQWLHVGQRGWPGYMLARGQLWSGIPPKEAGRSETELVTQKPPLSLFPGTFGLSHMLFPSICAKTFISYPQWRLGFLSL